MDVQHPPAEARHEVGRQDTHEPGEADDVGPRRKQRFQKLRLEGGAVRAESTVIDRGRGDAARGGAGQPCRRRVVRQDKDRPRRMVARHAVGERHHVRPAARDQDRDTLQASVPA